MRDFERNIPYFNIILDKVESIAEEFVSQIANIEVTLGREINYQDINNFDINFLVKIFQLLHSLEVISSFIKENETNSKIFPLWERLLKVYDIIPQKIIDNFGGDPNFKAAQKAKYKKLVSNHILLN